jgi:excisionase family DNA binding protein
MNLADAIRHAANGGSFTAPTSVPASAPVRTAAVAPTFTSTPAASKKSSKKKEFVDAVRKNGLTDTDGLKLDESIEDLTVTASQNSATAYPVKFELYLSPEQLTGLFKGVVTTQHSVMTLNEAARYLRIPGRKLKEMAQLGQIPAFLIDGKWRFARNSVEEWLAQRSFRKEMEA